MKLNNIGVYSDIDTFVKTRLSAFRKMEHTFSSLFSVMFSERGNILFERSIGYRIEKTTYGESADRILQKAAVLRETLSLPHDSIVGLAMDNGVEWIEAFWAILAAGYRPLLINLRLDAATVGEVIADTGAKAVVGHGDYGVPVIDGMTWSLDAPIEDPDFGSELFVMSSGTSAHVKVCAYSAEEIYHQICDSFDIITHCAQMKKHYEGELKLLAFLPFYHIFGLIAVYIWFAFFSRTFVVLNDLAPDTVVNTIRRHKVTHIFAVPLFWNRVYEQAMAGIRERGDKTVAKFNKGLKAAETLNALPFAARLFKKFCLREVRDNLFGESVQFMISGGSEIKTEVISFFNNIGYHLADGYGMSEIGITSVELSMDARLLNRCSVGKPLSSVEYRINENGELLVLAKTSAKYVLEGGVRTDRNGWFNTHDLAECRSGRYYILGRRDDLVVGAAGENLNPLLIEPRFRALRGVREACLIGVRETGGTRPTLVVGVDPHLGREGLLALQESVRSSLAASGLESVAAVYTAMPLIDGNDFKLNRRRIAERCQSGELKLLSPDGDFGALSDDNLTAEIAAVFAKALNRPVEEITDNYDFFEDGGGTSLDYFAALSMLNAAFSVSFPVQEGRSLRTVAEMRRYIEGRLPR